MRTPRTTYNSSPLDPRTSPGPRSMGASPGRLSAAPVRPDRVVGSRPVVREPDWLREPGGYDVSPRMRWVPVVTFLQVTADLAVATHVPPGHGYRYGGDVAGAWAAVLQPPGWTAAKTAELRPLLAAPE